MNRTISVLIVDDNRSSRQMKQALLEAFDGVAVVGEAKDGAEAIELARRLRPDVILLDVNIPHCDDLQVAAQIGKLFPSSKILLLSACSQKDLVLEAFSKGVTGYLVKGENRPAEIVEAIRAAARGEAILSPRMAGWVLDEISG